VTKKRLRIGIVQMGMSPDPRSNLSKAARMIAEAARGGADVVCLPELFGVQYFPSRRGARPRPETIPGPTTNYLSEAAKASRVVLVGGSVYERSGRRRYNACAVFSEEGAMLGTYRKVHIPQDEHYYEQDYFEPGNSYTVLKTTHGRFGVMICFDQWYPEAARVNRLMGAQVLFYPTAIGHVRGIEETEGDWKAAWERVQVGHAIANSVVVCSVNRVGSEGETTFWGGSFVCDQFGKILLRAGDDEGVFTADCELALGDEIEKGWGFARNRHTATYRRIVK